MVCPVGPMSTGAPDGAVQVAERYGLSIDDALIVAAALHGESSQLRLIHALLL
jgi:predicted nucleic acid-binding protein